MKKIELKLKIKRVFFVTFDQCDYYNEELKLKYNFIPLHLSEKVHSQSPFQSIRE